jgi:hypothetical protein
MNPTHAIHSQWGSQGRLVVYLVDNLTSASFMDTKGYAIVVDNRGDGVPSSYVARSDIPDIKHHRSRVNKVWGMTSSPTECKKY